MTKMEDRMARTFGEQVTVALAASVATVTVDCPPHNYVSVELLSHLADAFEAIDADSAARAIVLQSAGPSFCAGADLSSRNDPQAIYAQALRLFAAKTPIVAAVQGPAVGAGLGLALVADARIAAPEARFVANFVKLGFHPGFALTATLPALIGAHRAGLMLLTGRRIKPDEAFAWGLVDEVCPNGEIRNAAHALAKEIAANAPLGVVATRRTLRRELLVTVEAQMAHEAQEQLVLRATEDFREGVRAVAERRPPQFIGR
jgi:enoyl-CoA hydratase/carnithine racemase